MIFQVLALLEIESRSCDGALVTINPPNCQSQWHPRSASQPIHERPHSFAVLRILASNHTCGASSSHSPAHRPTRRRPGRLEATQNYRGPPGHPGRKPAGPASRPDRRDPQPSGGMAMERMWRSRKTRRRSTTPSPIHSSRDGWRQWRFSREIDNPARTVWHVALYPNMHPVRTYCALEAERIRPLPDAARGSARYVTESLAAPPTSFGLRFLGPGSCAHASLRAIRRRSHVEGAGCRRGRRRDFSRETSQHWR
jgi:hypothetical protein